MGTTQNINASVVCTYGAMRGFQIAKRTDTPTYISYDKFTFKYQCSAGNASDIVDTTKSSIIGTETTKTPVDVCKTSGPGHVNIPVGNTCSCPDGYVIQSLSFHPVSLANHLGLSCSCVAVKSTAKMVCTSKQTLRYSTDNVTGARRFTLYDYMTSIPVFTDSISVLKSVTLSYTNKTLFSTADYSANGVWFDYTTCYDSNSSTPTTAACNIDTVGVTDDDIYFTVYHHNRFRNQMATQTTTYGTKWPAAKNMRQMYWSKEIAKKAQEHANKCVFQHSTREFRTTTTWGAVGENLAATYGIAAPAKSFSGAVQMWNNKINDFAADNADPANFQNSVTRVIGHFTQVIWADTWLVGCGYSKYLQNGMMYNLYVCEYATSGNWLGSPVYKAATSTTDKACPAGTTASNTAFPGLCCLSGKCTANDYFSGL